MLDLLFFYVTGGVLLILLSLPLLFEKVKPNPLYGFRVPETLNDPAAWYSVNKYFARYLLATGMVITIAAVSLYFLPGLSVDAYALSILAIFLLVFSIAMVQSWKYLKSIQ